MLLPWGAWSGGNEQREFPFPGSWRAERLVMAGWDDSYRPDFEVIRSAVRAGAAGLATASIAVEDITRPASLAPVLEALLDALAAEGFTHDAIDIVVACGAHAAMTRSQIAAKVGPTIATKYEVRSHSMHGDLVDSGLRVGRVSVRLDRRFVEADFRIGVGSAIANPYAGFSGAGKIVVPGLADGDTLKWIHQLAHMGGSLGPGRTEGNRVRPVIDRLADELPLHCSVLCLVDERRVARQLFAGPPRDTYGRSVQAALTRYRTPVEGMYDVLFCNAYPKDAEFIQSTTGYTPIRTGALGHLAPGGTIVLLTAAYQGMGHHALFAPGGSMHRRPTGPIPDFGGAAVAVFAPGMTTDSAGETHWDGYPHFTDWQKLVDHLMAQHGSSARVGVFPAGAIQLGPLT